MYSNRLGIILKISLYNAMGLNDDGEEHTHAHTSQRRCKVYFTISAAVKSRITDTNRCFQDEKQSQIFAPVGLCVSHAEDPLAGAHEEDQNHVDQQQNGDHSEHRHRLHVQGHAAVLRDSRCFCQACDQRSDPASSCSDTHARAYTHLNT